MCPAVKPTPYQRPDDRYYRTRNVRLAAVLLSRGFPLVNIDLAVPARAEFVFRTSYQLEDVAERFLKEQTVLVEANKVFFAWQLLWSRIERGEF